MIDSGQGEAGPVAARYAALIQSAEIRPDPGQVAVARHLDELIAGLARERAVKPRGLLARIRPRRMAGVRGLYIHGEVGRGKTMLMDVFVDAAPLREKRRAHFHEFMEEVHDRIHAERQAHGGDAVAAVAAAIAAKARLLCLDEFAVTDIADAMILARLFSELFAAGVTLVATSNAAPEDLYRDGLNRGLFLPFIALLRRQCDVVSLDGDIDYRLEKLTAGDVYVRLTGEAAKQALDTAFRRLTGRDRGESLVLRVKGRELLVPEEAHGVARFAFPQLCEAPLASNDFLAIARAFHTVIIDGIPVIRAEQRDVARRFIVLVDTLYDHRVNLIASAAADPGVLYAGASGEVASAFKRTASRLTEMRSPAYLGAAHRTLQLPVQPVVDLLAPEDQSG